MKRAIFLATAALLAMLVLAPMAWTQGDTTIVDRNPCQPGEPLATSWQCNQGPDNFLITNGATYPYPASAPSAPNPPLEDTGGPAILLPAAALLLGSGILTYAILRRR